MPAVSPVFEPASEARRRCGIAGALQAGAACLALLCCPLPARAEATTAPSAAPRQNVIFILVDDLRFDAMGFLQPALHTPNIDRMAREGSYFPNVVVTSSLCSPSRATILTGMTTRNHGIVDNNDSSEAGLTYFTSYLQQAGYQTGFFGKWHMGQDSDAPRPGFDRWVSFSGQGSYWPAVNGATVLNIDGQHVPQAGYITDELTNYALDWLEHQRRPDQPFFLYLSHKAVHSDPLPAPRHAGQYSNVSFELPASAVPSTEASANKPMWVYNQRNTWHGIDFFYNADVPMEEYLRYYYGTLSAVDDSVGRILAYLEANDLARNTLVIFTSDNGYQIGEHGLIDKRTAYEPSVRVPFVAWGPGVIPAGSTNPGLIRNLDLAPTFLDIAGLPMPDHFEGQSAWDLLTGTVPATDWHAPDFIYEYYWEYNFPMTPTTFAIRRGSLKYIQYYGVYDTDELYDLSADPDELRNLVDDPAFYEAKQELRAALYRQLADREGRHVIPYGQRQSIGAVRRERGGTGAAPFPESWYIDANPVDRLDPILADSPAKRAAQLQGRPLIPTPPLGEVLRGQVAERPE